MREMGTLAGNLCQDTRCLQLNQKHDFQFKAPCFKRGGECCYPFPRNRPGTCWSVYMSDVAPALISLNAELETLRGESERRFAVENLFTGDGANPIRPRGRRNYPRHRDFPRRRRVSVGAITNHRVVAALNSAWR